MKPLPLYCASESLWLLSLFSPQKAPFYYNFGMTWTPCLLPQLKNLPWLPLPTKWQNAAPPPFGCLHLQWKKSSVSRNQHRSSLLSAASPFPILLLHFIHAQVGKSHHSVRLIIHWGHVPPHQTARPNRAGTMPITSSSSGAIPRQGSEQVFRKVCWVVWKVPMGQMPTSLTNTPLPTWPALSQPRVQEVPSMTSQDFLQRSLRDTHLAFQSLLCPLAGTIGKK